MFVNFNRKTEINETVFYLQSATINENNLAILERSFTSDNMQSVG